MFELEVFFDSLVVNLSAFCVFVPLCFLSSRHIQWDCGVPFRGDVVPIQGPCSSHFDLTVVSCTVCVS